MNGWIRLREKFLQRSGVPWDCNTRVLDDWRDQSIWDCVRVRLRVADPISRADEEIAKAARVDFVRVLRKSSDGEMMESKIEQGKKRVHCWKNDETADSDSRVESNEFSSKRSHVRIF